MIDGVNKVIVGFDDQHKAKAFWMDTVGFSLFRDFGDCPGTNWVELSTPDNRSGFVLARKGVPIPYSPPNLSNISFFTPDVRAAHDKLRERGVLFTDEGVTQQSWGLSAMFFDHEGNAYNISERGEFVE